MNPHTLKLSLALAVSLPLTVNAQTPPADSGKKYVTSSEWLKASGIKIPPVPEKFKHPGQLNTLEELKKVRAHIEAGHEPWASAFKQLKETPWVKLNYKPKPHETVSSGWLGAAGAAGGNDDLNGDTIAAYSHTLMWLFTDDERHAAKAAEILNAWSILRNFEGGNWYMMAQWNGSILPQSAELLRATYPGWKKEDQEKFSVMLSEAHLARVHNRLSYGNREFGVINALMAIGVFNDDRAAVTEAVHHWVSYVPNWIYLKSDGPDPIAPDFSITTPSNDELAAIDAAMPAALKSWIFRDNEIREWAKQAKTGDDKTYHTRYDQYVAWNRAPASAFVDGLCAETFRDLGHVDLGLAQLINTAEIAWHQGIDLYSIYAKRIVACFELYAELRIGETIPKPFWSVNPLGMNATFEIAYNHYHNRMGMEMPWTRRLIEEHIRPCVGKVPVISPGWCYVTPGEGIRTNQITYPAVLCIAWETLTHAELDADRQRQAK